MPRTALRVLPFLLFTAVPYEQSSAQGPYRTTRTLTVGATAVDFEGWGGSLGAVLAQFSLDRGFRDVVGGELGAFALVPLGGSSAIPGCPVGLPCETRTTPNLLFGVNGSLLARAGDTGLRAAIGVGPVWATGGEGLPESVAWSALLGLDWVANSKGRFALTLSARALLLETSLAGATYLFLPGIGVTF